MIKPKYPKTPSTAVSVLAASMLAMTGAYAADHQEAPGASAQLAADIGDYYVWHDDNQLNLILTFGTFAAPEQPASFDRDILYSFHFDTSTPADGVADTEIHARFSQNTAGEWGLQVSGIGSSPLEGPVETVLSNDGVLAWAGLADDPFFFHQTGFRNTVSTGTLSFDPAQDDVAGLNVTAIAIQLPVDTIVSGGSTLQTWTTTSSL